MKKKLLVSTALVSAFFGSMAAANAACVAPEGSNYVCSGKSTSVSITNTEAKNLTFTTEPGFEITGGDGLSINNVGSVEFVDAVNSIIFANAFRSSVSIFNENAADAAVVFRSNGQFSGDIGITNRADAGSATLGVELSEKLNDNSNLALYNTALNGGAATTLSMAGAERGLRVINRSNNGSSSIDILSSDT
ncbi:hypothetical protein, partial [Brucella thiophenivorans]|uniref:hypothetical protein n=1 Tax=Brucella thiophenivorans TaxID=571255 RepID=UPI0035BC15A1